MRQGGYGVASLQVGYRINRNLSASLTIDNLFDRHYSRSISIPFNNNYYGALRSAMVVLRGTF